MNLVIASKLETLEQDIKKLSDSFETAKAARAIKAICSHLRGVDGELSFYTLADFEVELYQARAVDIARNKELTIKLAEFRQEISALQARSSHFEAQCNDYLRCIKKYQSEISSLTSTVHKHQRNFEATSAENDKLKTEIQELKVLNTTMADSISEDRRTSMMENATMRAELNTLQKSTQDYKAAFASTRKKLQLTRQRHMNLLGMTEPLSPMGEELDSTSVTWTEEGLSAQQPFGLLLGSDGIARTVPAVLLGTAETTTSLESNINLDDLSDLACLL